MAADRITYPNKVAGDLHTHQEANAVKVAVNEHADELDALNESKANILNAISSMLGRLTAITNQLASQGTTIGAHTVSIGELESAVEALESQAAGILAGVPIVVNQSSQVVLQPNVLNRWGTPQTSITVDFADGTEGHVAHYMMRFTVSGDDFTLTLPSGVRWMEEPDFTDGYTYEISIVDGIAVYGEAEPVEEASPEESPEAITGEEAES